MASKISPKTIASVGMAWRFAIAMPERKRESGIAVIRFLKNRLNDSNQKWIAWPWLAWAASWTASLSVGWAWIVAMISS